MAFTVTIQNPSRFTLVPSTQLIRRWARLPLRQFCKHPSAEICVRIVDKNESEALNHTYRQKQKPTNVLSFPYKTSGAPSDPQPYIGDIAICAPLVAEEALEEDKTIEAHWAHLIIHGVLHLLGFDHVTDSQAQEMEKHEINFLKKLGYPNPYGDE